jgi:hypothetical protein
MKRSRYLASVKVSETETRTRETQAWNSAIRATEAMVREIARAEGVIYHGSAPKVEQQPVRVYRREWWGPVGGSLSAEVREA